MAASLSSESLPLPLSVAGSDFIVNQLTPDQAPLAYQLVREEALHGEDMGWDEFASEAHLKCYIDLTPCFCVTDTRNNTLESVIIIAPSAFSRMDDPVLADGKIICAIHLKGYIIGALIELTIHLATGLGYEGLLLEAYRTSPLLSTLQAHGFHVTGCIPSSGNLVKHGWTESFITLKELHPKKAKDEAALTGRDTGLESDLKDEGYYLAFKVKRPRLSYLPRCYTFSSGQEAVLRYTGEEDIPTLYDMYREASLTGDGYSTDEFPNISTFRFFVIDHGHAFILEDPATSTIIISMSLTPSTKHRSANTNATDVFIIMNPNYKRQHLGTEVGPLMARLCMDLGYRYGSGDVMLKNSVTLKILWNQGFTIVGFIPKAARGPDGKLEEVLIFSRDLRDKSKFLAKF